MQIRRKLKPPENKMPKTDVSKQTFGPKPQTASVKPVRKWEKELDIQLQYEVSQSDESVVILKYIQGPIYTVLTI